jgi:hypothetical protein
VTGHAIGTGMVNILRIEGTAQHAANLPMILPLVAPKTYWHRIYEMDI